MSSEKKAYYQKLQECCIEIPEVDVSAESEKELPTAIVEVVPDKGADKLEEMVKSQNELKKNLSQLQSQLSKMATDDDVLPAGKRNKPKKPKKSGTVSDEPVAPWMISFVMSGVRVLCDLNNL